MQPGAPVLLGGLGGDLGRLLAVVAPVRDEVLEDDLLEVVEPGERLERGHAVVLGLADADEDAAGERDAQVLGGASVASRSAGALVGDAWWATRSGRSDSIMRPWLAVTSRSRARSSRSSAPRFVCGSRPRSRARSHTQAT